MTFDENLNYTILSNKIDKEFLSNFGSYQIIDYTLSYNDLLKKLDLFPSKRVIFNNTFYNLKTNEINHILNLLKIQNVHFTNITSNIEEVIYSDYIMVYNLRDLVLKGKVEEVLTHELELKHLGYSLPFAVDLSTQLKYYGVLNKTYYNINSITEELWN